MNEATLNDEQWEVIKSLLPPQPRTGCRRQHDREVLNSMVYRLVAGSLYRRVWQEPLSLLERDGKVDLNKGSLDGSFVPAKRGTRPSTTVARERAQR